MTESHSKLPLLMEAEDVLQVLDREQAVLIDLTQLRVYKQAHLPNARWLDGKRLLRADEDTQGLLPTLDYLQKLFLGLGITRDSHVIVYDDEGGGWAGRMVWTLDCIGHTRYSVLNGGIHAWLAQGFPIDSGEVNSFSLRVPDSELYPQASDLTEASMQKATADLTEILADVNADLNLEQPTSIYWDCRSEEEFLGQRLLARRGGHIPTAIHYEWSRLIDKENNMRLRPFDQIREELTALNIINNAPVITYCQSHHRSGLSYFVGKLLGLPIRAYAGAWSEWGNQSDTPIAK